jgi:hypothetical protein
MNKQREGATTCQRESDGRGLKGINMTTEMREVAVKVLGVVDKGLCHGVGKPVPGQMCVEAAVCYAMGLPHGDDPSCVSPALRHYKIRLNDSAWSSNEARARGLRRLAVAQLGSNVIDDRDFAARLAKATIQRVLPPMLRRVADLFPSHAEKLRACADQCEQDGSEASALAASSAASSAYSAASSAAYSAADSAASSAASSAAYSAADSASSAAYSARDAQLTFCAEVCIDVLRDTSAPGIALMDELCPL